MAQTQTSPDGDLATISAPQTPVAPTTQTPPTTDTQPAASRFNAALGRPNSRGGRRFRRPQRRSPTPPRRYHSPPPRRYRSPSPRAARRRSPSPPPRRRSRSRSRSRSPIGRREDHRDRGSRDWDSGAAPDTRGFEERVLSMLATAMAARQSASVAPMPPWNPVLGATYDWSALYPSPTNPPQHQAQARHSNKHY